LRFRALLGDFSGEDNGLVERSFNITEKGMLGDEVKRRKA